MVFDSGVFLIFFACVFVAYHSLKNFRAQNVVLLLASLVFYGWWDWRFLGLLLLSSGIDYVAGLLLSRWDEAGRRKAVLAVSMSVNLGILFIFKYFDFFSESISRSAQMLGISLHTPLLHVV